MSKDCLTGFVWTDEADARLKELRLENTMAVTAQKMGITYNCAQNRCQVLDFQVRQERQDPPKAAWVAIATECALAAGVDPVGVMSGQIAGGCGRIRSLAWKTALDRNPTWSIAGLGRTSGFHHTTILHALRRTVEFLMKAAEKEAIAAAAEVALEQRIRERVARENILLFSPAQAVSKKLPPSTLNTGPEIMARRMGSRA